MDAQFETQKQGFIKFCREHPQSGIYAQYGDIIDLSVTETSPITTQFTARVYLTRKAYAEHRHNVLMWMNVRNGKVEDYKIVHK